MNSPLPESPKQRCGAARRSRTARFLLVAALAVPAACSRYTPPEMRIERAVWEHRFDIAFMSPAVWRPEGGAALHAGVLETGHVPERDQPGSRFDDTRRPDVEPGPGEVLCLQAFDLPDLARDGRALRLQWTFTPGELGEGSQRVVAGPGLIEIETRGGTPVLNGSVQAHAALEPDITHTFACDFDRGAVLSWTIDGVEQLAAPALLAGNGQALGKARVRLGDPAGTGGATRWHWIRLLWLEPQESQPAPSI